MVSMPMDWKWPPSVPYEATDGLFIFHNLLIRSKTGDLNLAYIGGQKDTSVILISEPLKIFFISGSRVFEE